MTVERFYEYIGGDYAGTKSRLMTDERIARFVKKFPADGSYQLLLDSLNSANAQEAFRAAHTIKGVAQNLGFTSLYQIAEEVTEILRPASVDAGVKLPEEVKSKMPELEKQYNLTIEGIGLLDD